MLRTAPRAWSSSAGSTLPETQLNGGAAKKSLIWKTKPSVAPPRSENGPRDKERRRTVQSSVTPVATFALFAVMAVLAAVPSASVMLVVTRAATHGFRAGVAVTLGIVAGDLVFLILALGGMSAVAQTFSPLFAFLKLLGGAYLIGLGIRLLRAVKAKPARESAPPPQAGVSTSFLAGLLLTLGDVKAIMFYASLLPLFVDLTHPSPRDVAVIMIVTLVAVGGVKSVYALAAHRIADRLPRSRISRGARIAAAVALISAGVFVITSG